MSLPPDPSTDELRAFIDDHDGPADPPTDADEVLAAQRRAHEDETQIEAAGDGGIQPLVDNVGDDGGAPTG